MMIQITILIVIIINIYKSNMWHVTCTKKTILNGEEVQSTNSESLFCMDALNYAHVEYVNI